MENSNTRGQESHSLWISQREYIISFHAVENNDFEQLVFSSQDEKMKFAFQKCSIGFRIQ